MLFNVTVTFRGSGNHRSSVVFFFGFRQKQSMVMLLHFLAMSAVSGSVLRDVTKRNIKTGAWKIAVNSHQLGNPQKQQSSCLTKNGTNSSVFQVECLPSIISLPAPSNIEAPGFRCTTVGFLGTLGGYIPFPCPHPNR